MKKHVIWGIAAAVLMTGCATAPEQTDFDKHRIYDLSRDAAWERLISYFANHDIQIKTIEKVSGIIYAERSINTNVIFSRGRILDYADCGHSLLEVPLAHTIDLNVFVREPAPGKTDVTVNTSFHELEKVSAAMGFATTTTTVDCASTGRLEKEVLDAVGTPPS